MQQPRTTRLEDIGTNSRCSQCGYTRVDLPYKSGMNRIWDILSKRYVRSPKGRLRLQEHSYRTEGSRQHYCRYGKCRWRHDSRRYIRQDSSYRGCQPRQGSFERDTSHSVWFLCTHHFCYDRVHALPRQRGQWQPHTDNPCPGQSSPPCQPSRWGVLAGGRQVA